MRFKLSWHLLLGANLLLSAACGPTGQTSQPSSSDKSGDAVKQVDSATSQPAAPAPAPAPVPAPLPVAPAPLTPISNLAPGAGPGPVLPPAPAAPAPPVQPSVNSCTMQMVAQAVRTASFQCGIFGIGCSLCYLPELLPQKPAAPAAPIFINTGN